MFYLFCVLPAIAWGIQWYYNRKVVWQEAAIGTAAALVVATVFHVIGAAGAFIPQDTETYSGLVQYAQYQPRWREYYEEAVYRTEFYTDSQGNTQTRQVFSHWQGHRRWHDPEWWVETEIGQFSVDQDRYNHILAKFGNETEEVRGVRRSMEHASRQIDGPKHDDRTVNRTKYEYPIADDRHFENRLLKASTLYNFQAVPEERLSEVFEWPTNKPAKFESDRLIGSASEVWDSLEWDKMCGRLGPSSRVNVIGVGFPAGTGVELGMLQERHWRGGKKNDLVLCFGGNPQNPEWAYVFGWTERQAVKRLLENRIMSGDATIETIEQLIIDEYELLEFEEKFEHVEVAFPYWFYILFFAVVLITQGTAHFIFHNNSSTKDVSRNTKRRRLR